MKIALGIKDNENKELNEMFARSPFFLIVEIEKDEVINEELKENHFADQTSGAGIAVIEDLAKAGVDAIICANLGPKASDLSKQLEIKAYKTDLKSSSEAMKQFINNNLSEIN